LLNSTATKLALRKIPKPHNLSKIQYDFRTKRHLWTYSGLALETHDSAQYRVAEGQLQRSKKPATVRGLNKDYNHDLKDIFKGATMRASTAAGPMNFSHRIRLGGGDRRPSPLWEGRLLRRGRLNGLRRCCDIA